jgi:hypothetical protein
MAGAAKPLLDDDSLAVGMSRDCSNARSGNPSFKEVTVALEASRSST